MAGWSLVLATRNGHKLKEFERILAPEGIAVEPLPEHVSLPPEDGTTFEENALGKAQAAAAALGRPVLADDSGIEAAALGGRPGVRSARFAGEGATDAENLAKLLRQAPAGSALRYVCVVAYVDPTGRGLERLERGQTTGRVASAPAGAAGFGYDPAFVPDDGEGERTFAELSEAEKDRISHRGRAARAFARWYRTGAAGGGQG